MPRQIRKRMPRAARSIGIGPGLLASGEFARGLSIPTLAGTTINSHTALTIAAVWAAVNIYANTIASLDLHIAERTGRNLAGRKAAPYYPTYPLLHRRPNQVQTSFRFRQTIMGHAITRGNGYAEIIRAGRRPVAIHLMDPGLVDPRLDEDGRLRYFVAGAEGPLPPEDVLHVAGLGWDGVRGYSPVTLAAEALGLAKAEQTWQSALFGNNAQASGYFKLPGSPSKEAKAEFRREVQALHGGASKAGKFGILSGGAEWVKTSFSPSDAQLILGRQFSIAEVARIFNLPQHMLGNLDKATFSNIEQQNIQFYQLSLLPWLTSIEQEMTAKLVDPEDQGEFAAWFDASTLLRGDLTARTSHAVSMFQIGVNAINDVADEFGYKHVDTPGADKHWVQVNNMAAIEDMDSGKVPEPGTAPGPAAADTPGKAPGGPVAASDATRAVLSDAIGRMVRREGQAARKAARRDAVGFDSWYRDFLTSHREVLAEAIAPAVRLASEVEGRAIDPGDVAAAICAESAERYRGLVACCPPDELPGAVERACDGWEQADARALDAAERLLLGTLGA